MHFRWGIIIEYMPLFITGAKMTLIITVLSVMMGTVIGLLMGIARLARSRHAVAGALLRYGVRLPASAYVTFFRGTPLFVQIMLMHFGLMPLLISPVDGWLIHGEAARMLRQEYGPFLSGLVALTLNAGAYITEIFRAGIQSIDRGQFEAARSLGLGYAQAMRFVLVPQAFRRMLPPLGNEAITLLKDSSLVSAIGLSELAYAARTVAGVYSRYWEPYLAISLVYLMLTLLLAAGVALLERRFAAGRSHG
jgi:polar amino acid transport system permease protein